LLLENIAAISIGYTEIHRASNAGAIFHVAIMLVNVFLSKITRDHPTQFDYLGVIWAS